MRENIPHMAFCNPMKAYLPELPQSAVRLGTITGIEVTPTVSFSGQLSSGTVGFQHPETQSEGLGTIVCLAASFLNPTPDLRDWNLSVI